MDHDYDDFTIKSVTTTPLKITVCTRSRSIPKPCCGDYGADEVLRILREDATEMNIDEGECTLHCHEGVVVIDPATNTVYKGVKPENAKKLIQLFRNNDSEGAANTDF